MIHLLLLQLKKNKGSLEIKSRAGGVAAFRGCLGQAASSSSISHGQLEGKKHPQAVPVLY